MLNGALDMGHARALLALDGARQIEAAQRVAARGLSARETEALVKRLTRSTAARERRPPDRDVARLEEELSDGSMVSVYPVFESFDITSLLRVRQSPLRQPRFVLDVHLGKLASRPRLLGFDTLYRNDYTDTELLEITCQEGRVLLSKDRRLLQNEKLTRGYHVGEKDANLQTEEVMRRFDRRGSGRARTGARACLTGGAAPATRAPS